MLFNYPELHIRIVGYAVAEKWEVRTIDTSVNRRKLHLLPTSAIGDENRRTQQRLALYQWAHTDLYRFAVVRIRTEKREK